MSKRTVVIAPKAPKPIGPYSVGVWAGDLLFVSGQTPLDPSNGEMVPGGVQEQAKQVLDNIAAILEAAGLSLDHVVKATVFLKDMNDFGAVNEIYGQRFASPAPARSCVQVARLPKDALVEIEVIATK